MFFRQLRLDAVNRAHTTLEGAAGKAINVAKVLRTLGERPLATGFLGGARGERIRRVLETKAIEAEFVNVLEETRECVTIVNESDGSITELVQESAAVSTGDYESLRISIPSV
jgi:fructose-1-phosphate kinase PfkB-like protein